MFVSIVATVCMFKSVIVRVLSLPVCAFKHLSYEFLPLSHVVDCPFQFSLTRYNYVGDQKSNGNALNSEFPIS